MDNEIMDNGIMDNAFDAKVIRFLNLTLFNVHHGFKTLSIIN